MWCSPIDGVRSGRRADRDDSVKCSRRLGSLFGMVKVRAPRLAPCQCAVTCRRTVARSPKSCPTDARPNTSGASRRWALYCPAVELLPDRRAIALPSSTDVAIGVSTALVSRFGERPDHWVLDGLHDLQGPVSADGRSAPSAAIQFAGGINLVSSSRIARPSGKFATEPSGKPAQPGRRFRLVPRRASSERRSYEFKQCPAVPVGLRCRETGQRISAAHCHRRAVCRIAHHQLAGCR